MTEYLWKSMKKELNSYYGKKKWRLGKWYKKRGRLKMCKKGFHGSKRIIDSMHYVPLENLARVEVGGDHLEQSDKQCWQEMKIIKAWNWTKKDSVALAVYAANLVLENFEKENPEDKRPRKAIQIAKKWLRDPTKKNQEAAESAARAEWSAARAAWSEAARAEWSAARAEWSAARAAWSAAWSAARAAESAARAAESAAWSAAWSAARAAESAARAARAAARAAEGAAIFNKCEKWIRRRINKLEVIGEIK